MAACKKNAARLGAHLAFLDESGFLLIPPVRKTWGPRGQTPIHRHVYRHDRISAISAISVSPQHRRLGLYCHFYPINITREEVCVFLRDLLAHLRGHVIVVLDNAQIHRGGSMAKLCARFPRLHIESFPPYAPELNPDEGVWRHLKRAVSNTRPDDQDNLLSMLTEGICTLSASQRLLRSCIKQSDLPPFLP
jgi:transposase